MQNNNLYDTFDLPDEVDFFLPRARLDALLSAAVKNKVVTVGAGAGFGKTQAVTAFLRRKGYEFIYLKLTPLDNYTMRFWHHFTGAAHKHLGGLSGMKFPDSAALFHEFLRAFSDAPYARLILVFDDFHQVSEPQVVEFIENIIHANMKKVCVMLVGRTITHIGGDNAARITDRDLLFNEDEVSALFDALGVSGADMVLAGTGGWAAALHPAAIAFKRGGGHDSMRRKTFELVERVVFSGYSPAARRALIALSVYDRVPFSAAHAELGGELNTSNPFFTYNAVDDVYDMHDIFRDFLRKKQATLDSAELCAAHRNAAEYHRARGDVIDALSHYDACGCYGEIWDIIAHYDIGIPTDVADYFIKLVDNFPPDTAETLPLLPVVRARFVLNNGFRDEAEREFLRIVDAYENSGDERLRGAAGESYLFLGLISLLSFDERYAEFYKKADAYLPDGSSLIDGRLTFSKGNYMILVDDPSPGSVQRHVELVHEALPYGVRAMNGAARGVRSVTAAEAAYYMCDARTAEMNAHQAIYQAEQKAQYDTICAADFLLLRVYLAAGNYPKATACLKDVHERIKNAQNAAYADNSIYTRDIMEGWYYSRLGDTARVPEWIMSHEKRERLLLPNNFGRDPLVRAYCLLTGERFSELSAYSEVLVETYDEQRLLVARIEARIFKAVAANKLGNSQQALAALTEAYSLAAGNRLFMPFIELGRHMRAVIYAVKQSGDASLPVDWLDAIYSKSATYEKHLRAVRSNYGNTSGGGARDLTRREKDVLRLLCQGLTSAEIAAQIYVSASTVKKSLVSIYDKLGASNRAEAVSIASVSDLLAD